MENDFLLQIQLCRLCRRPSDSRTSIFHLDAQRRVHVSQMVLACTGVKIYDFDRLPQRVCADCFEELGQAYTTRSACIRSWNHPRCTPGEEMVYTRCRVCAQNRQLISMDLMTEDGLGHVLDTFERFSGPAMKPFDGMAPYLCRECCVQLERGFAFRQRCLQVEASFVGDTLYPWEKMEFRAEAPTKLVVEPYARLIVDETNPRVRKCSVCHQFQSSGYISAECEGCWLKFSRGDRLRAHLQQQERVEEAPTFDAIEDNDDDGSIEDTKPQLQMATTSMRYFLTMHSLTQGDAFPTLEDFPSHSKIQRTIPMCHVCCELFPSKEALDEHCTQEHPSQQFVCSFCLTCFGSVNLLQQHIITDQHGVHEYCKLCDRILLTGRIDKHMKLNHQAPKRQDSPCTDRSEEEVEDVKPIPDSMNDDGDNSIPMPSDFLEDIDIKVDQDMMQLQENAVDLTSMDCDLEDVDISFPFDEDDSDDDKSKLTESSNVIPAKQFRKFLEQNDLKVQDLFEVLEDNEYGYKLRRKKPLCCACNTMFLTKEALKTHLKTTHPKPESTSKYTCKTCYSTFKKEGVFSRHLAKQKSQFSVYEYCKQCDKILTRPKKLIFHLFYVHCTEKQQRRIEAKYSWNLISACNGTKRLSQRTKDVFMCTKCGKKFNNEEDLSQHEEQKEYECRVGNCTFKTMNRRDMIQHSVMTPHTDSPTSATCLVPFDTLGDLFEIGASETDLPYRKVQRKGPVCCGCDMFFAQEMDLIYHKRSVHKTLDDDDDAIWCCETCRETFENKKSFESHNQKREVNNYDYCVSCELVLMEDSYYEHELKYHPMSDELTRRIEDKFAIRSETLYKCCLPKCNTRFDSSTELFEHWNDVHSTGKVTDENTCLICKTRFDRMEDFVEHRNRKFEFVSFTCRSEQCTFFTYSRVDMAEHRSTCTNRPDLKGRTAKRMSDQVVKVGRLDELIDIYESNGKTCCGCRTVWDSVEELQKHIAELHSLIEDDHPFRCSTCKKGFLREGHLLKHLAVKAESYSCRVCKIRLKDMRHVDHHKAYVHSEYLPTDLAKYYEQIEFDRFPCCGCSQQFDTVDALAKHCLQKHPKKKDDNRKSSTKCENCHQHIPYLKFPSHVATYASKLIYKCKIRNCYKKTTSLQMIRQHVSAVPHESKIYLKASNEIHTCCIIRCEYSASSLEDLMQHCTTQHSNSRGANRNKFSHKPFSCTACCRGFDTEVRLLNHQRKSATVGCRLCYKKVPREQHLEHLEKCKLSFSVTCEVCGEQFNERYKHTNHMKNVHGGAPKQKYEKTVCNLCGRLVVHIAAHMASHENKREYACKQCPLRFNWKTTLIVHTKNVHGSEKKYVCRMGCDKSYKISTDRERHERIAHTRDLPFKCTLCTDAFVRDRDLRLHMRKHTGRKLYPCSRCDADFDRKSEWVEHEAECFAARVGSC